MTSVAVPLLVTKNAVLYRWKHAFLQYVVLLLLFVLL